MNGHEWHRKADLVAALSRDVERRRIYRYPLPTGPVPVERQARRESIFAVILILITLFGSGFLAVAIFLGR